MNFLYHNIVSQYIIDTTTDIFYLQLLYSKKYESKGSYSDLWFGYDISVAYPAVKLEQDISFYYHLALFAEDTKLTKNFAMKAMLFYEHFNFVNLPEIGEGLQGSSNSLLNLRLETDSSFAYKGQKFHYGLILGYNFMSTSDYDNLSSGLTGLTYGLKFVVPQIYGKMSFVIGLETTQLKADVKTPIDIDGRITDSLQIGYNKLSIGTVMDF